MGSIGDCFDNALIESFWSRMQVELLDRQRWKTRVELAQAIFDYLEIFHNRQRRHSVLDMRTSIEYEALARTPQPRSMRIQKPDSTEAGAAQSLRQTRGCSEVWISDTRAPSHSVFNDFSARGFGGAELTFDVAVV